jgi:hypothetical protein
MHTTSPYLPPTDTDGLNEQGEPCETGNVNLPKTVNDDNPNRCHHPTQISTPQPLPEHERGNCNRKPQPSSQWR